MTIATRLAIDPARVLDQAIAALNQPDSALPIEAVHRALGVVPNDSRLWHVKGLIHREHNRRELAIPALRRAAELAPNEPLIAHGYARTLLEAGLPSLLAFERAMKLSPNNPNVVKGMVAALVAERRVGDAIAGLETALRRSPLWTDGHGLLASLCWAQGYCGSFTRSFDEALKVHPDSLELRRSQLIALIEAEQFEAARERLAEGRRRLGSHPLFIAQEAVLQSETGEVAAADRLFSQLEALKDAALDLRRVRHFLRSARPEEAAHQLDYWLGTPDQEMFWPYAATAWRLSGDARSQWLEAGDRLVGTYDMGDRLPPLGELAAMLRTLHTTRSQPFGQSVRGGTQTDGHLFHRIEPVIVQLREAIRDVVAEHSAAFPPIDPAHPTLRSRPKRIQFTGAWSVRLKAAGHHANHVHPRGWLSSALYLALPPDLGQDHAGWLTLGEPQAQLNLPVEPLRWIQPEVGRLVLFPSWMWHGTRPFAEGERLTVAFDVARLDGRSG